MTQLALIFVAGVWLLQHVPTLPSLNWLAFAIPLAGLCLKLRRQPVTRKSCIGVIALLSGFSWAAGFAYWRLSDELPAAWEVKPIRLVGVVASMPQMLENGERFEFDVEKVLTPDAHVPRHISLTQYVRDNSSQEISEGLGNASPVFHAGERWQLTVRLKRPHGTLNPHGFDFEAWALERDIRATGSIRKDIRNMRLSDFVFRPGYIIEHLRERIRDRMSRVLEDKSYRGILQALAIGDENAIAQQNWQIFLRTGTAHLMSISGLHITMLSGLVFGWVHALWRRAERLTLALPARKAATLAGVLAALAYALLAGFSVPTQRTFYMLMVFALALWSGRRVPIGRVMAMALLVVVLLDPWAVLAPGFWLSFGAVAVIAFVMGGRVGRPHWLREAALTQWAVTLGLIPLLLVLFQQISIVSPLANALAIPVVSLVVVPLTLAGSLLPMDWPLNLAHALMAGCMQILQAFAEWPLSNWQQHAPPGWTLPLAILGVLWMLLPRGFPLRWLGMFWLLPMILVIPEPPKAGGMKVAVMDVGQGLAVVVRTASHTLLYDTGPRYSSQSDSGSRILIPYLRGEGVRQLDGLIVSHNDTDHSGGMASILAQMPVGWLASTLPEESLPSQEGLKVSACMAGQRWSWDGVQFEVLYPLAADEAASQIKDNNRSCVVRVVSRYGSLLLTGDIEKEAEAELLAHAPEKLVADVLVVPHHGSKTSSIPAFIEAVRPSMSIFTVGYLNRFNHPKPAVLERYERTESHIYRSDRDGAVIVVFSREDGLEVTRWRTRDQRYWRDPVLH